MRISARGQRRSASRPSPCYAAIWLSVIRHDAKNIRAAPCRCIGAHPAALEADSRVVFGYLFGGLARGRVTPLSDVDIGIFLVPAADFTEARLDLIHAVTDALDSDAVDVVVLNEAPLSLAGRIQQSAKVLVDRDPQRRYAYESLTRRMFWDFRTVEDRIFEARYGVPR